MSLAAVLDGTSRTDAARVGGMDRQPPRDWVHRFNDHGPDGLKNIHAGGREPRLSPDHKDLPSRSPALNAVENLWQYLRSNRISNRISNRVFDDDDAIIDAACNAWTRLMAQPQTITSIGMRKRAHVGQSK